MKKIFAKAPTMVATSSKHGCLSTKPWPLISLTKNANNKHRKY